MVELAYLLSYHVDYKILTHRHVLSFTTSETWFRFQDKTSSLVTPMFLHPFNPLTGGRVNCPHAYK